MELKSIYKEKIMNTLIYGALIIVGLYLFIGLLHVVYTVYTIKPRMGYYAQHNTYFSVLVSIFQMILEALLLWPEYYRAK